MWTSDFSSSTSLKYQASDGVNGEPRYGIETRSINITIKIWRRIA